MSLFFFGKLPMVEGGFLFLVGASVCLLSGFHFKVGALLAGDIFTRKGHPTIWFSVATCIVLSLIITLLLNLLIIHRR